MYTDTSAKKCFSNCGLKYLNNDTKECITNWKAGTYIYNKVWYPGNWPANTYKSMNNYTCSASCGSNYMDVKNWDVCLHVHQAY